MIEELEQEEEVVNPYRDLMMRATYSEARTWIEWIRVMTVDDLADSMWVAREVAEQLMKAALWHGIVYDTGDSDGRDTIYEYVPIPDGPRSHYTHQPEWQNKAIGCGELAPPNRGMPIRIRTERDMRKIMSTSGGAGIHKRREKAYQKMQEAVVKRKAAQEKRRAEGVDEKKWRKHKKNSIVA